MYLKDHIVRVENMKSIQTLDAAGIDHKVIAMFMNCEGIPIQSKEIAGLLNSYTALAHKKLSSKKVQALMNAKQRGQEDEALPCPAAY
jgi:hypothetical protein